LLEYQNFLQHRSLFLRFQQNCFDSPTKLFSVSSKILDLLFRVYFSLFSDLKQSNHA